MKKIHNEDRCSIFEIIRRICEMLIFTGAMYGMQIVIIELFILMADKIICNNLIYEFSIKNHIMELVVNYPITSLIILIIGYIISSICTINKFTKILLGE